MTIAEQLGIKINQHPLYAKFQEAGLRIADVAHFVGFSNGYVSHVLLGYKPGNKKMETKLQELARRIDQLEPATTN